MSKEKAGTSSFVSADAETNKKGRILGKIRRTKLIGARMAGDERSQYMAVAIHNNEPLMIMWCGDPKKSIPVLQRWFTKSEDMNYYWADDLEFPDHVNLQSIESFEVKA